MGQRRRIKLARTSNPTVEGAGVRLRRAFGNSDARDLDPFLLLDDFRSRNPSDFLAGFPWHPHRGIETITYMLEGTVEHQDSIGNRGVLGAGDLQWMTAGGGILHQEMPGNRPALEGFQLWANLPASDKMMDPRYQDIASEDVPVVVHDGIAVRVMAGSAFGEEGPVRDVVIDPEYLDVAVPPGSEFRHETKRGHTVGAYVFDGAGDFTGTDGGLEEFGDTTLLVFDDGDEIRVRTGKAPVRFILFSGRPLNEPIAWAGPIVMNTRAELQQAFDDLDKGSFVRPGSQPD
ncbi:MAG: hypothetical protein DCC49_13245 [Acidobacteria bacterium]|nr:MAG: hypothetical protein DCC49_13245 [Acidobacteriota bacterium]